MIQTIINWKSYPENKPLNEHGFYHVLFKGGKGYYFGEAEWTTYNDSTVFGFWAMDCGIREYDNVVGFVSDGDIEHKEV